MKAIAKLENNKSELPFLKECYKKAQEDLSLKKYQQIKAALKELCYGCQTDSPFLSIRKICKAIDCGPVPVQRAITELIAEDILYAKNGIGLFIKNPPIKTVAKFSGHHTVRKIKELNFLYNDKSERNQAMMLNLVDRIRKKETELADVKLLFEPDATISPDIAIHFDSASEFLDVSDFASYDIQREKLKVAGKYSVPLSYVTYYLFYNETMLDELEIDKPSYTSFSEQQDYIRKAKKQLEQKNLLGPTSWGRALYLLGGRTNEVLEFLKGKDEIDSPAGKRVFDLLSTAMDYYKLFSYENKEYFKSAFGAFLNSETPIFAGNTNCLVDLEQLKGSKLNWKAYPMFNCDNTLPLIPIYATIDANTRLPMECVLFLRHMQNELSQKNFYERGYITIQRTGKYLPDSPAFKKAAKASWGGYLEGSADNYLFEHILDFQLINGNYKNRRIQEIFENIFHYSRGYMRNFS